MLNSLRSAANSWTAKLLLIVLLLCFALLWGTSSFHGVQRNDVFVFGKSSINAETYDYVLREKLLNASIALGLNHLMNIREANQYAIPNHVDEELLEHVVFKEQARKWNIGITKEAAANAIAQNPTFARNGNFDKEFFQKYTQRLGITQKTVLNYLEQREKNKQIKDAITADTIIPNTFEKAFLLYDQQKRDIEYVKLSGNFFLSPVPPENEILQKWYEAHKQKFKAPEYRTFVTLDLQKKQFYDPKTIKEEDVKAYYKNNEKNYKIAQKRDFEQLTFPTKDSAQKALDEIKLDGKNFEKYFNEKNDQIKKIKKENSEKDNLEAPLADTIFSLKENEISSIIQLSETAYSIVKITKIKPEEQKTFEEVRQSIIDNLANENALKAFKNASEEINKAIENGETIQNIAKKYNYLSQQFTVDSTGKDNDEMNVGNIPAKEQLLKVVFQTEIGMPHKPLTISNENYVWYDVLNIIPERIRPFEEVKHKIYAQWDKEEKQRLLTENTNKLLQQLKDGETLENIAERFNVPIEKLTDLARYDDAAKIDTTLVSSVFETPYGEYGLAITPEADKSYLFKVIKLNEPKLTADLKLEKETSMELNKYLKSGIIKDFMAALQKDESLRVNVKAYQQLTEGR